MVWGGLHYCESGRKTVPPWPAGGFRRAGLGREGVRPACGSAGKAALGAASRVSAVSCAFLLKSRSWSLTPVISVTGLGHTYYGLYHYSRPRS